MRLHLALLAATAEAVILMATDHLQDAAGFTIELPGHALASATTVAKINAQNGDTTAAAAPILGCTTSSFSTPSWFVRDLTFNRTDDSVTFDLLNRATNYTAFIGCANATADESKPNVYAHCDVQTDPAPSDDSLLALVRVTAKGTAANVLLRQRWACSDRTTAAVKPINFSAAGSSSTVLTCDAAGGCVAVDSPLLVRGNLAAPVAIHSAPAEGPIGHSKAGCSAAASKPPSWSLQSVYYLNQTGDNGATAISSQTLMLQVINHAIGYQAGCTGFLSDDLSTKPVSFTCAGQGYDFLGRDRYRIQTQALFEPATFNFTVNQTWYCDDTDEGKPVSITASGSTVLPLNCTSVAVGAGDNAGNKTTCLSNGDIVLQAQHPGTVASLPPYSVTDPLPTPDGCTVSSIVGPAWTLSSFEIDTDPRDPKGNRTANITSVGFDLRLATGTNEATYPISVYQGRAVEGKPQWFHCTFGADEIPLAPYNCTYTYDAAAKQLTLAADWICSDLDRERPVLFSGTATTAISKPFSCSTAGGQTQCLTDETASWNVPIANVTWRAADKDVLAPS
ncbi:uncharacterized protein SPSK_08952 [Sporothrix schenckii 1099-18]|uniref:Ig-like domain-containing protein n=1 Tax=Sporothrix schenckii 1099-18 TaxID=1397361 RepID=A0A0F2M4V4_SPOSC|nr:uncharacterized protein SPSK_08952 [Sporothrix schenckii 1099-18]KJR84733.1 hypothetical protein SPSK_08952 [Sporothrix schenckii 1099-18]